MSKKSFVRGAAILAAAGIVIKIIGAVYKIVLGNFMTADASSYYAMVYPWYNALLAIAAVAVPATVARLVSEKNAIGNYKGGIHIIRAAFKMMVVFGLFGTAFLYFGADLFSGLVGNPGAANSFRSLSFAVFFVSMMAVIRGYFQGIQDLKPFAISQIVEQLGRVSMGFVFVFAMKKMGDEWIAAGATLGATSGAIIGFITILVLYFRYKRNAMPETLEEFPEEKTSQIIKKIIVIAVPIAMGHLVGPLLNMIDSFIVINRLTEIGFIEEANDMYSYIAYYSISIINLPQVLITAVQISLLPAVAEMMAIGNKEELNKIIKVGVKLAAIIGIPAAVGIMTLSTEILSLLYPARPEVVANASSVLGILGLSIIFMSMYLSTTSILQGMGKQLLPARNLFIGAVAKVFLCYTLVGIPSININGAAISTVVTYVIAMSLNIMSLSRHIQSKYGVLKGIVKPLISAIAMGIVVRVVMMILPGVIGVKFATVVSILIGALVYMILLLATNTFTEDDYEFIPGSKYIKKLALVFRRRDYE